MHFFKLPLFGQFLTLITPIFLVSILYSISLTAVNHFSVFSRNCGWQLKKLKKKFCRKMWYSEYFKFVSWPICSFMLLGNMGKLLWQYVKYLWLTWKKYEKKVWQKWLKIWRITGILKKSFLPTMLKIVDQGFDSILMLKFQVFVADSNFSLFKISCFI